MDTIRLRLRIYGRVQGVFFRASAEQEAGKIGVSGFVRNEPDGSVVIEVEGGRTAVDSFVEWAKQGPSRAVVERIVIESLSTVADDGFVIL